MFRAILVKIFENPLMAFRSSLEEEQKFGRRHTDRITKEQIKKEAKNGSNLKEMITELKLLNKAEHSVMNMQISWLSKFAWIIISILVTGVFGGLMALIYWAIKYVVMEGLI